MELPRLAKMVTDPIYDCIEIAPVLPLVETPEFQALAEKRQLSLTSLAFPSATHSRLAHSLGAYHATRGRADRWIRLGLITKKEGDAMCVHALLHDIGHPAYSHVVEDLCPYDHKRRTVELVTSLVGLIASCGVDHDLVLDLVQHRHPLWAAVADKNIGTEKLDYLERDGLFTGQGRPMGIGGLRNYVYFLDGRLVIDSKASDAAMDVQTFYMKMYKNVYLRKSLVIAQRMFKKMVYHLIVSGDIHASQLFDMNDQELMAAIIRSSSPRVRNLYGLFRNRQLFKETVVLRPDAFADETRIADKPIHVIPLGNEDMRRITGNPRLQMHAHDELDRLEDRIETITGLPADTVLVVPVFNPERFDAQDITVLQGNQRNVHSLRAMRPGHFASMEETARSYTAFRICTTEEHRQHLSGSTLASAAVEAVFSW